MLRSTWKCCSIIGKLRHSILPLFLVISLACNAGSLQDTSRRNLSVLDSKITLNVKNKSLINLLEILSQSHSIDFIYIEEQIPSEIMIAELKGEFLLKDLLARILKNTGLTYFLIDQQIGLTSKEFSASIEIDSNKQAKVYASSSAPPDLMNYKKVKVKSIQGSLPKKYRVYYIKRKISLNLKTAPPTDSSKQLKDTLSRKEKVIRRRGWKSVPKLANHDRHSLVFKIGPGFSEWKIKANDPSKVDNVGMNSYEQNHASFSTGLQLESNITRNFYIRIGLGYLFLNKRGSITNTKINEFYYPFIQSHEVSTYSYKYSYFNFPVSGVYRLGNKKVYVMMRGELSANLFLSSDMIYYPVFQVQYYTDINPLSRGSEPYHSGSGDPILKQEVEFQPLIFSVLMTAEAHWAISEKNSVFIAPEISTFLRSVYNKNAPVSERPSAWGISIGYKYSF